jgi:hypothetical protein
MLPATGVISGRRVGQSTPEAASTVETQMRTGTSEEGWQTEAEMPVAQSNMASGVIDGELYCVGGIRSGESLDAVVRGFAYDPAASDSDAWTRIPDMPKPLWGQCGVSDGQRLFAFGGAPPNSPYRTDEPPTDEILMFEPGDGWTNLSETDDVRCPYPTWVMQGVYNPRDGLVYNVGGARYRDGDYGDESAWVWTFDPKRREVVDAPLTRLPTKRRWATVGLLDVNGSPLLHVVAGQADEPVQTNDRYDIEAEEWETAAPAPAPGIYAPNYDPVIDNRLYLTHGLQWGADLPPLSNESYALVCWAYDPATDSWETDLESPTRKRAGSAADTVIDGTLYIAGGHRKQYDDGGYHDATSYVESFTP